MLSTKIVNRKQLLTIFAKKAPHRVFIVNSEHIHHNIQHSNLVVLFATFSRYFSLGSDMNYKIWAGFKSRKVLVIRGVCC